MLLPKDETRVIRTFIGMDDVVYDMASNFLDPGYVETLQTIWSNSSIDWSNYNNDFNRIQKQTMAGSSHRKPQKFIFLMMDNIKSLTY